MAESKVTGPKAASNASKTLANTKTAAGSALGLNQSTNKSKVKVI